MDPKYLDIVSLFEDSKKPVYSIHQIALMGESTEKKPVGTWFGPNTVAQVLRLEIKVQTLFWAKVFLFFWNFVRTLFSRKFALSKC